MSYIFVGLGNPGEEYEKTRHNTGRMLLEFFAKEMEASVWKTDSKLNARVTKVKVGKSPVTVVLPETFMNNSGKSVKLLFPQVGPVGKNTGKQFEKLVVVYDDLDLPFGTNKISFNKSSGGHRGVESIIKALKTEKFARIRIGVAPTSPTGKIRKPQGEEKVIKHILGEFKPEEMMQLKKLAKKVTEALTTFVTSGIEKAMTEFN